MFRVFLLSKFLYRMLYSVNKTKKEAARQNAPKCDCCATPIEAKNMHEFKREKGISGSRGTGIPALCLGYVDLTWRVVKGPCPL